MTWLAGRTVLITGSTDGLGLAVAETLVRQGACVLVHGRSASKLERALVRLHESASTGPHGYLADLSSLEQTRRLAHHVASEHDRVDVLINNAGIVSRERQTSRDGHELGFSVNYLSHFLLTLELLPKLAKGDASRIVNVASIGQRPLDFSDLMLERAYDPMASYAQSKLAQIMFTFELAGKLGSQPPATVNALHPATLMDTNMVRRSFGQVMSTVEEGRDATVRLAVDPELDGVTGKYFDGMRESTADPQAYDPEAREQLWSVSEAMTGIRFP